jgi:2'-5' RNA ligase
MHLTLRFIGEVDGAVADDIHGALSGIKSTPFSLELAGCGTFGPRGREPVLWLGVKRNDALVHLRDRIEAVLVHAGLPPDTRKFHPHVTLARLKNAPKARLSDFVAANSYFQSVPFGVEAFHLFSSFRAHSGAIYRIEAEHPLGELQAMSAEYALD